MIDFTDIQVFVDQYIKYASVTKELKAESILSRFYQFKTTNTKVRRYTDKQILAAFDYVQEMIFIELGHKPKRITIKHLKRIKTSERNDYKLISHLLSKFALRQ